VHQYFSIKDAEKRINAYQGGIIWHTQGSGKSLTMVWLAKWIRENIEGARVLVITDRTELDEQIEKVFNGVGEDIRRTKSGADLVDVLNATADSLICSLIHKFGSSADADLNAFLADIEAHCRGTSRRRASCSSSSMSAIAPRRAICIGR
jgi:type I restriction enzyme R subunit